MKNIKFNLKSLTVLLLSLVLLSCQNEEFDGLLNVDGPSAVAVTFPQSTGGANGLPLLEDNAYIIQQNSLASGNITVEIAVPEGQQIQSLSVTGQRFRGTVAAPNLSPTIPAGSTAATSTDLRAPAALINRNTAPNLGTNLPVTPGSKVTYTIPVNNLPAALTKSTLGAVQKGDAFRFFFRVKLADGSEQRAIEARVIVTG
jgi:hypothetical protein